MHQSDPSWSAAAGFEGRRVSIDADLAALRREGYDVSPEAEAFVGDFTGVEVQVRDRSKLIIGSANGVEVTFRSWGRRLVSARGHPPHPGR